MANFNTLPLELVEQIVKSALVIDTSHLPTIGIDASYFIPHYTDMGEVSGLSRADSSDSARAVISLALTNQPMFPHKTPNQPPFGLCVMVASLRLVNRTFNAICVPILYKYVNLLAYIENPENFNAVSRSIIIPYSQHIQNLYIYVDSPFPHLVRITEKYAASILGICRRLVTLGLYYHHRTHRPKVFREVVSLAETGTLAHLGIYSQNVLTGRSYGRGDPTANEFINCLATSPHARNLIQTLEFAVESISMDTFIAIQTKFPSLHTLTFRNAIDNVLKSPLEVERGRHWIPYRGLKRLQLTRYEMKSSMQIPLLLRLFPALRELLVSGGSLLPYQPTSNRDGPIIPHQPQVPLDLLHIESMQETELQELVNLRATTLTMVSVQLNQILSIFKGETTPFPGLKILRVEPGQHPINLHPASQWMQLSVICIERAVDLRQDAVSVFGPKRKIK